METLVQTAFGGQHGLIGRAPRSFGLLALQRMNRSAMFGFLPCTAAVRRRGERQCTRSRRHYLARSDSRRIGASPTQPLPHCRVGTRMLVKRLESAERARRRAKRIGEAP